MLSSARDTGGLLCSVLPQDTLKKDFNEVVRPIYLWDTVFIVTLHRPDICCHYMDVVPLARQRLAKTLAKDFSAAEHWMISARNVKDTHCELRRLEV